MRNKNRIKLTESQLRDIIAEEIRKVGWRVPMHAAQKLTGKEGWNGNVRNLTKSANRMFSNKYDIPNAEEGNGNYLNGVHMGRTGVNIHGGRIGFNQRNNGTGGERYHQRSFGNNQTADLKGDNLGNNINDYSERLGSGEQRQSMNQRYFPTSKNFRDKIDAMSKDMDGFYNKGAGRRYKTF